MDLNNKNIWIIILWAFFGFIVVTSFVFAKDLIDNLVTTFGFVFKIEPHILKFYPVLSNTLSTGFFIYLLYLFTKKRKEISPKDSNINYPIKLVKKSALLAIVLYSTSWLVHIATYPLLMVDYYNMYMDSYGELKSLYYIISSIGNLIAITIATILFFKISNTYSFKKVE
jgi:hypothetical protein